MSVPTSFTEALRQVEHTALCKSLADCRCCCDFWERIAKGITMACVASWVGDDDTSPYEQVSPRAIAAFIRAASLPNVSGLGDTTP